MKRIVLIVAVVSAVAVVAAGIAIGAGGRDDETPITGAALSRASAAALDHLGGGRVSDTEEGDEDGFYEVEVTLADGRQIDVHLDRNFNVLDDEADVDEVNEDEASES
jgi:uncharacterized membrane protein YkoI